MSWSKGSCQKGSSWTHNKHSPKCGKVDTELQYKSCYLYRRRNWECTNQKRRKHSDGHIQVTGLDYRQDYIGQKKVIEHRIKPVVFSQRERPMCISVGRLFFCFQDEEYEVNFCFTYLKLHIFSLNSKFILIARNHCNTGLDRTNIL